MNSRVQKVFDDFFEKYPQLINSQHNVIQAFEILRDSVANNGTIYTCGNGGSYADSMHVVGELLKGFRKQRPLTESKKEDLQKKYGNEGFFLSENLQQGIRSMALGSQSAFNTAYANDKHPTLLLAQELHVIGCQGDVLICFSTSGNSKNIYYASLIAKDMGIKVILITGNKIGMIASYSDCVISVPESETYKIQELHLPVYHLLCMGLEETFFYE